MNLLGPTVPGLELVERRPHGARVAPLAAAVHILGAAASHDAILARADGAAAGVFAHVPLVLPATPWVTLPHAGQLFRGENRPLQLPWPRRKLGHTWNTAIM